MAGNFEDAQLEKTLFVVKGGDGKYRINQYYQIQTRDGDTYLRPIPSGVGVVGLGHLGLAFDKVEFVPEPSSNKDGLLNQTHDSVNAKHRLGP